MLLLLSYRCHLLLLWSATASCAPIATLSAVRMWVPATGRLPLLLPLWRLDRSDAQI